jgi:hypothetical protein
MPSFSGRQLGPSPSITGDIARLPRRLSVHPLPGVPLLPRSLAQRNPNLDRDDLHRRDRLGRGVFAISSTKEYGVLSVRHSANVVTFQA